MPSGNITGYLTIGAMGGISDVLVDNVSVVTDGVAYISLTEYLKKAEAADTYATKTELTDGLSDKQDALAAGNNIDITNNVISAEIEGNPADAATESDLTKLRIGDKIFPMSGGGIKYNTSEFDTGMKWTDGKTIYGKVLKSPSMEIGSEYYFNFPAFSTIIKASGSYKDNNNHYKIASVPDIYYQNGQWNLKYILSSNCSNFNIIIYYTKN